MWHPWQGCSGDTPMQNHGHRSQSWLMRSPDSMMQESGPPLRSLLHPTHQNHRYYHFHICIFIFHQVLYVPISLIRICLATITFCSSCLTALPLHNHHLHHLSDCSALIRNHHLHRVPNCSALFLKLILPSHKLVHCSGQDCTHPRL